MTVFPIKKDGQILRLSASFGKAKYFAFYDGKDVEILENQTKDGMELISWVAKKDVKNIIMKEIGSNPYKSTQEYGMNVYYCDDTSLILEDVIDKINKNEFKLLDDEQVKNILKKHDKNSNIKKKDSSLQCLIFPTDENLGENSKMGAHFGRAKFYTIIALKENKIVNIQTIENVDDDSECDDSIGHLMQLEPDGLIVSDIGSNPIRGFLDAGVTVYSDSISKTVEESVGRYIKNLLVKI